MLHLSMVNFVCFSLISDDLVFVTDTGHVFQGLGALLHSPFIEIWMPFGKPHLFPRVKDRIVREGFHKSRAG